MARRTFLLDLDGTIWDSRSWYAEIVAGLSSPRGSPVRIKTDLAQGKSVLEVAEEFGVSKGRLEGAARDRGSQLRLYDGVRCALDVLRERGASMGLVTNLAGWLARPLIEATDIRRYFSTIVTPVWGVPRKPSPRGIVRALNEMEREVDLHTWLVGDECTDAAAARAAGVRFAWASYGYGATISTADAKLGRFAEVLEL